MALAVLWGFCGGAVFGAGKLAIITREPELAKLADVLTATLSARDDLQLLERNEIDRVLKEQSLAGLQPKDFLKVGELLGADGLLFLETAREEEPVRIHARLVAARPGVVLGLVQSTLPVADPLEWSRYCATQLGGLFPKLTVLAKDAVPISVLNLRSAVSSAEAAGVERKLTRLLHTRLAHQKEVFVLERREMEALTLEKALQDTQAAFWNGSYLLEGTIDKDGTAPGKISVSVRLLPPHGGAPVLIEVAGPRENLATVIDDLASRVLAVALKQTPRTAWRAEDEAERYLAEARWAMRWYLLDEVQSTSDTAWALGNTTIDTAILRVRGHALAGLGHLEYSRYGLVAGVKRPPNPERIKHVLQALRLFSDYNPRIVQSGQPDLRWYGLGTDVIRVASQLLQDYQLAGDAQREQAEPLAELRRTVREVSHDLFEVPALQGKDWERDYATKMFFDVGHDDWREGNIYHVAARFGGLWQDHPEDGVKLFEQLVNGPFLQRLSAVFMKRKDPWLVGWNAADRARARELWAKCLTTNIASTNAFIQLEKQLVRLNAARPGDPAFAASVTRWIDDLKARSGELNLDERFHFISSGAALFGEKRAGNTNSATYAGLLQKIRKLEQELVENDARTSPQASLADLESYLAKAPTYDETTFRRLFNRYYFSLEATTLYFDLFDYTERLSKLETNRAPVTFYKNPRDTPVGWSSPDLQRPAPVEYRTAWLRRRLNEAMNSMAEERAMEKEMIASLSVPVPAPKKASAAYDVEGRFITPRFVLPAGKSVELVELLDARMRQGRIWAQFHYSEVTANPITGDQFQHKVALIAFSPDAVQAETLETTLPGIPAGGFEILGGYAYVSHQNGLARSPLNESKWEKLSVPIPAATRLTAVGDRLYATTADSIIEFDPATSRTTVLASNRRNPPVNALDAVAGYNFPPIFAGGSPGGICALVQERVYEYLPAKGDWVARTPVPSYGGMQGFDLMNDRIILQDRPPYELNRSILYSATRGSEVLFRHGSEHQRTNYPNITSGFPRWTNAPGIWPVGEDIIMEGDNAWVLQEIQHIEPLDLVYCDARSPVPVPFKLGLDPQTDRRQMIGFDRRWPMIATPGGLFTWHERIAGFWYIPTAGLKQKAEPIIAAQAALLAKTHDFPLYKYDVNGDGRLDEKELEALAADPDFPRDHRLLLAGIVMECYDRDHNGVLAGDEIKAIRLTMAEVEKDETYTMLLACHFHMFTTEQLLQIGDKNQDGQFDLEEFANLILWKPRVGPGWDTSELFVQRQLGLLKKLYLEGASRLLAGSKTNPAPAPTKP